jgi:hypothetical protein
MSPLLTASGLTMTSVLSIMDWEKQAFLRYERNEE